MWPFSRPAHAPETERRDDLFLTFEDVFSTDPNTHAGVAVASDSALTLPAVFRCIALNAETIASLPVDCLVKRGDVREPYAYPPSWLTRPNGEYDWGQFIQEVQTSLEMDGNAFILKVSTESGRLFELWHLAPQMVSVDRARELRNAPLYYRVTTAAGVDVFPASAILHIKAFTLPRQMRGLSPIMWLLAQTIGTGLAAQEFGARFFGDGAHLSGVVESPTMLNQEQQDKLRATFKKRHGGVSKSHALGILTGGAKWVPMSVKPEEAQFLETQKFTAVQIAQAYGIPPEFVTDAEGAKGYVTGLHMRMQMWNITGLNPRIVRLERAFSGLLTDKAYVRFNRNAFLQMDPEQRTKYYAAAQMGEWMTPDEIRAKEDMNPLGGDYAKPLKSVQWHQVEPPGDDETDDEGEAA